MWRFYTEQGAASAYGTALPGSPTDGQEFTLVDSTTLPTYQWRFRYNAGSSNTDKWEFVGGTPALIVVETAETTASASYAALATAGPSFTVPRAGVYEIAIGTKMAHTTNATGAHSFDIGGTGAVDADAVDHQQTNAAIVFNAMREVQKVGLAASTALVSKYKTSVATATFSKRWMRVTPVRVS